MNIVKPHVSLNEQIGTSGCGVPKVREASDTKASSGCCG
jgi:hypothetical protein